MFCAGGTGYPSASRQGLLESVTTFELALLVQKLFRVKVCLSGGHSRDPRGVKNFQRVEKRGLV